MRGIANYLRRHHIGLLALFIALGGTAYAVSKAPKDSVVSRSIKDGQVKVKDARFSKAYEYPDVVTISDDSAPQQPFKVTVPKSGLVSVFAQSEIRKSSGAANLPCTVGISTTGDSPYSGLLTDLFEGPSYNTFRTAPGSDGEGVNFARDAGSITYLLEPGVYDFRIAYSSFPNTNCLFRNTKLVVTPLP